MVRRFTAKRIEETEAVPLANGQPSTIRLRSQISGDGDFLDVHSLLFRIAVMGEGTALDFEALHLKARDGGTVTFDARLTTGCRDSAGDRKEHFSFSPRNARFRVSHLVPCSLTIRE